MKYTGIINIRRQFNKLVTNRKLTLFRIIIMIITYA